MKTATTSSFASDRPIRPPITATKSQSPELRSLLMYLASERGLANNSIHAYRRDLEDTDAFLSARGKTFLNASVEDYHAYLQDQSRKGQSTKTIARRVAALRVFLRFLLAQGVDTTPVLIQLERPKPEANLPKILSRAQVVQLISSVNPKSYYYFRDVAILELLYASGLRASELCDLKMRDANLDVCCVRVLGKGMKERIVPFGRAAKEAIQRYLLDCRPKLNRKNSDRLFLSRTGQPMERIGLWMLVEKRAKQSGLLKQMGPHVLRHCFATHLIGGGADLRVVQELLGHSDISTTQVYMHVDSQRLKSMHAKYHPRG